MFKLKSIDPSIKILAVPLIVIVGTALLVFYLINTGYARITSSLEEMGLSQKSENTLEERVEVLKEFQAGVLDDRSDLVYSALPDKNPGAAMVSQLRKEINDNGLSLVGLASSPPADFSTEIKKGEIVYKIASPDIETILRILSDLANIAPISTIEEVAISRGNTGSYIAELKLPTYWSSLPAELPAINEPIEDLSAEDRELMARIFQYRFPTFLNLKPGERNSGRQNPFD